MLAHANVVRASWLHQTVQHSVLQVEHPHEDGVVVMVDFATGPLVLVLDP